MLVFSWLATKGATEFANGRGGDARHFYSAAVAARSGGDLFAAANGDSIYPAIFASALVPLAGLTMAWAGAIWAVLNGAMIVVGVVVRGRHAVRSLGLSRDTVAIIAASGSSTRSIGGGVLSGPAGVC